MPRYIDADALRKKILNTRFAVCYDLPWNRWWIKKSIGVVNKILEIIKEFPSADVEEVRHGEWKRGKEVERAYLGSVCIGIVYDGFTCSACGYKIDRDCQKVTWSYCPFCGAKMDGEESVK